jgi:CO dehydrogenase maturation factor
VAVIAITGKGGVGKTTVAALLVRWLVSEGRGPVLAVDADSNANFNELLGVTFLSTVGGIREEARALVKIDPGMSKQDFLGMKIRQALVEQDGYDLLVMGRPEGPGCYCYANNVLRDSINQLASGYRNLVIDCEAGMEHLSRRTLLDIDYLITVSDPSVRGLHTAGRISELLEELRTRVRHRCLAINKIGAAEQPLTARQQEAVAGSGFRDIFFLPFDPAVAAMDSTGGSVDGIGTDSPVRKGVAAMMRKIIIEGK